MEVWIIVAIVVALVLLRIFFKLAKFVLFMGLLLIVGIVIYNVLLR